MKYTFQQYARLLWTLLSEQPKNRTKIIRDFVLFLHTKKADNLWSEILSIFQQIKDQEKNILKITIHSAHPINEIDQLTKKITAKIDQPNTISNIVDPQLIGGQIVYLNNWKIDYCIKSILRPKPSDLPENFPDNYRIILHEIEKIS